LVPSSVHNSCEPEGNVDGQLVRLGESGSVVENTVEQNASTFWEAPLLPSNATSPQHTKELRVCSRSVQTAGKRSEPRTRRLFRSLRQSKGCNDGVLDSTLR
jgi:hypothetical protein